MQTSVFTLKTIYLLLPRNKTKLGLNDFNFILICECVLLYPRTLHSGAQDPFRLNTSCMIYYPRITLIMKAKECMFLGVQFKFSTMKMTTSVLLQP